MTEIICRQLGFPDRELYKNKCIMVFTLKQFHDQVSVRLSNGAILPFLEHKINKWIALYRLHSLAQASSFPRNSQN